MSTKEKIIKDFIYADIDRVYSLYSQINEGVASQIIQSYLDASSSNETQKSLLKGGSIEAQVAEVSRRTENKLLYDHMYNLLEAELHNIIVVPNELTEANYRDKLKNAVVIKVKGTATVDDYERLDSYVKNLNKLGEALATLVMCGDEFKATIQRTEEAMSKSSGNDKNLLRDQLKQLKNPKLVAEKMGMGDDEKGLAALNEILDLLYVNAMKVTITPSGESGQVNFTGIADKRWLRIEPDFLRALYGGSVDWEWTMVGQITHIPGTKLLTKEEVDKVSEINSVVSEGIILRDPIHQLFERLRALQRIALEGKQSEVIVQPLAIYREIRVPSSPQLAESA